MRGATVDKRVQSVYESLLRRSGTNSLAARTKAMARARQIVLGENLSAVEKLDYFYTPNQPVFLAVTAVEKGKKRFDKPILPLGEFRHPVTGRVLSYTEEKLSLIEKESNRFLENGHQCAFSRDHSSAPDDNLGWWAKAYRIAPAADPRNPSAQVPWIWGSVDVDDAIALSIDTGKIKHVSPGIRHEFTDSLGNTYGPHFYHVSATNTPVIPNQQGFERVELSVQGTRKVFAVNRYTFQGDKTMFSKKVALALGLAEGASEDDILSAITATPKGGENDELSATVKTLADANKKLADEVKAERKARHNDYLSVVKSKAVALGTPLEDGQVKQISDMLDQGFPGAETAAKTLADSFLSVCELKSKRSETSKKVEHTEGRSGKSGPATEAEKKQKAKNELLSSKEQLEGRGYVVKIEGDELSIVSGPGGQS